MGWAASGAAREPRRGHYGWRLERWGRCCKPLEALENPAGHRCSHPRSCHCHRRKLHPAPTKGSLWSPKALAVDGGAPWPKAAPLPYITLHVALPFDVDAYFQGLSSASFRLAVSLVQNCAERLEPHIRGFLISSFLERDTTGNELKDSYHEIIFEIFQCAPQMLIAVIPNLTEELLTDQVDVRIKALNLIGKLLSHSKLQVAQEYRPLFIEFLKRFSDKSAEVRVSVVECAKACYLANSSRNEVLEVLTALEGRLLDFDDKVRIQAVTVVCELAKFDMRCFPSDILLRAADRLRDKKVSVRKRAMVKLLELYRAYCIKCSEGVLPLTDHFEQIPCRILNLCFEKDCKEFSLQKMEIMLAEDLFPASLSAEERTCHWIALFSFFSIPQQKALNSILVQKQSSEAEENGSSEVNEKISVSLKRMASSFVDSIKAGECFQKLNQMKDNNVFKALLDLVDEQTFSIASCIRLKKDAMATRDPRPMKDTNSILPPHDPEDSKGLLIGDEPHKV
ncbi:hypothetical protein Taro_011842, partial [Colocasia esculenta]|nr:hypothetical protein [Colocasia esculenta]